jgi:hypothetical protein
MFIRGWSSGTSTTSRDPLSGSRTLGSVQEDAFESHNHRIRGGTTPAGGGVSRLLDGIHQGNNSYFTDSNTDGGDTETRPINIALLYCIKT